MLVILHNISWKSSERAGITLTMVNNAPTVQPHSGLVDCSDTTFLLVHCKPYHVDYLP